jgi:hypothetical protein
LLNRIIDKTLSRTPGMMALLRNAVAALPPLVEQLETGRHNSVPIEALMSRAFAYADRRRSGARRRRAACTRRCGPDRRRRCAGARCHGRARRRTAGDGSRAA